MTRSISRLRWLVLLLSLLALPLMAAQTGAPHVPNTMQQRLKGCFSCHGKDGQGGANGFYPRIGGKPAGYLYHQLINFQEGRRGYATMRRMVAELPHSYLHQIADYFASQNPPFPEEHAPDVSKAVLARGQQLVEHGDAARKVPACSSCHGKTLYGVKPDIPGLIGLPYNYITAQLGSWRNGDRHANAPDCMATIASRLAPQDVNAVAAWLATRKPSRNARPQSIDSIQMPMTCGSVKEK